MSKPNTTPAAAGAAKAAAASSAAQPPAGPLPGQFVAPDAPERFIPASESRFMTSAEYKAPRMLMEGLLVDAV